MATCPEFFSFLEGRLIFNHFQLSFQARVASPFCSMPLLIIPLTLSFFVFVLMLFLLHCLFVGGSYLLEFLVNGLGVWHLGRSGMKMKSRGERWY